MRLIDEWRTVSTKGKGNEYHHNKNGPFMYLNDRAISRFLVFDNERSAERVQSTLKNINAKLNEVPVSILGTSFRDGSFGIAD